MASAGRDVAQDDRDDFEVGPSTPSNKGMKLTKPSQLRSFAAYPRRSPAINAEVFTHIKTTTITSRILRLDSAPSRRCASLRPARRAHGLDRASIEPRWALTRVASIRPCSRR